MKNNNALIVCEQCFAAIKSREGNMPFINISVDPENKLESTCSWCHEDGFDTLVKIQPCQTENNMEELYEKIAKYNALIIDSDDLVEQDINSGIIKIDKRVFDGFVENAIIYIYCADIDVDVVMEFVMKSEEDDVITMEWLDCFSI